MAKRHKTVLGMRVEYEDGLWDYNQSGELLDMLRKSINQVNREVVPEHRRQYFENYKKLFDSNQKHWKEQLNKIKSDAQQQINTLNQEISKIRNKSRNLTAEQVSVYTYHANMLKSKAALLETQKDFEKFTTEILEAPMQVRQAFFDNASIILEPLQKSVQAQEQANEYSGQYDPLKININKSEIKNILESVEKSLLSDADLATLDELNLKIKEYEKVHMGAVTSEIAMENNIGDLNSKLNWELVVADSGDEE